MNSYLPQLEELCRVCLSCDEKMQNIYPEGKSSNLASEVMECASVQISPDDGLPRKICIKCVDKLQVAFDFRTRCQTSDKMLRRYVEQHIPIGASVPNMHPSQLPPMRLPMSQDISNVTSNPSIRYDNVFHMDNVIPPIPNHDVKDSNEIKCSDEVQDILRLDIKEYIPPNVETTPVETDDSKYSVSCAVCDVECKNRAFLAKHFRIHIRERLHYCEMCKSSFSDYNTHLELRHNGREDDFENAEENSTVSDDNNDYNDDTYDRNDSDSEPPPPKPVHTKVKRSRDDRDFDRQFKNPIKYKCSICSKKFVWKQSLKKHIERHFNKRPYQCEICGKTYASKVNVREHMGIHTGVRPYKCDQCGKTFVQRGNFNLHKRLHSGLRPHTCEICGKSFTLRSSLNQHLNLHTLATLYKCEFCDKKYTAKSGLWLHKRKHTGDKPFKCDSCDKRFAYKHGLESHRKIHDENLPHVCHLCGHAFRHSSALYKHQRSTVHNVVKQKPVKKRLIANYLAGDGDNGSAVTPNIVVG